MLEGNWRRWIDIHGYWVGSPHSLSAIKCFIGPMFSASSRNFYILDIQYNFRTITFRRCLIKLKNYLHDYGLKLNQITNTIGEPSWLFFRGKRGQIRKTLLYAELVLFVSDLILSLFVFRSTARAQLDCQFEIRARWSLCEYLFFYYNYGDCKWV